MLSKHIYIYTYICVYVCLCVCVCVCTEVAMGKLSLFWIINFAHALCLLQVLSVVHCLWEKKHHDAIHFSKHMGTASYTVWHSYGNTKTMISHGSYIWRQCRGLKKNWMSPVVITKVRKFRILSLIVLIWKELLNLFVRSKPWLPMIPASQSGS